MELNEFVRLCFDGSRVRSFNFNEAMKRLSSERFRDGIFLTDLPMQSTSIPKNFQDLVF